MLGEPKHARRDHGPWLSALPMSRPLVRGMVAGLGVGPPRAVTGEARTTRAFRTKWQEPSLPSSSPWSSTLMPTLRLRPCPRTGPGRGGAPVHGVTKGGRRSVTAQSPLETYCVCIILQGQPAFHVACLYGQLATIKQLLESSLSLINSSDLQGRRAVHMVMSSQSWPRTSSCLRYLLQQGADINV
ncbi:hypothetical protein D4764_03G0004290 [Takifugu flavidus]|uniref:Uncharacterized protein n=1 Tax=Takifugu flavidus TaxID=433684 RepID=A0A5C6NAG6_9TELE|nr:hypothetical protein D4764_03G0004290 [Takifugu flavidus]